MANGGLSGMGGPGSRVSTAVLLRSTPESYREATSMLGMLNAYAPFDPSIPLKISEISRDLKTEITNRMEVFWKMEKEYEEEWIIHAQKEFQKREERNAEKARRIRALDAIKRREIEEMDFSEDANVGKESNQSTAQKKDEAEGDTPKEQGTMDMLADWLVNGGSDAEWLGIANREQERQRREKLKAQKKEAEEEERKRREKLRLKKLVLQEQRQALALRKPLSPEERKEKTLKAEQDGEEAWDTLNWTIRYLWPRGGHLEI